MQLEERRYGWFGTLCVALVINLIFLLGVSGDVYHAITQAHAHIGYQVATKNSLVMSRRLATYEQSHHEPETFVNYHAFVDVQQPDDTKPFPVNDTIGYGVVMGLVWKLTRTFDVRELQWLQILLYLISLLFIYRTACIIFASRRIAWWCTFAQILFFPIIALNVQAVRDIWAYYATVLLLWSVVGYMYKQQRLRSVFGAAVVFALLQWVRPTVFFSCIALVGVLALGVWMRRYAVRRVITWSSIFIGANLLVFWLPLMMYNYGSYERYIVGPVGQDLLEGLGEFSNPWGHKLSDEYVAQFIGSRYGVTYGTPEFDDKAREEFQRCYAEQPLLYWMNVVRRIPSCLLPGLPWLFPKTSPYQAVNGVFEKMLLIMRSAGLLVDFFLRHMLIRVLLLIGYLGMYVAWRRGYWLEVLCCCAVLVGGLAKLPSHIEYRYLVPFYWIFPLFIGYAIALWRAMLHNSFEH